jgi:trans-aconitate methyltransferase
MAGSTVAIVTADTTQHWDGVYSSKAADEVSWFQTHPKTSLRLVTDVTDPAAAVIDVGAGASHLADELLHRGFTDITVLDVSAEALEVVRVRLADRTPTVTPLVTDLLTWHPTRQYDTWHDRAVFHFLTTPDQQQQYLQTALHAIPLGGHLVLGTFAADGPTHCSGLPTARYDATALTALFSPGFTTVHTEREQHQTPGGQSQAFTWVVLRRT